MRFQIRSQPHRPVQYRPDHPKARGPGFSRRHSFGFAGTGGPRIGDQAFVHAAGIHRAGPLAALSDEDILSQIQVNLTSATLLSRKVLQLMIRQRAGSIVLIGSVSAHRMIRGHAVYSATKAALEGFCQGTPAELAKRSVRVNCVLPGPVMGPMLREAIDLTGDNPA